MADMTIFPTGLTYSRNTKAPFEDKKLFDTLALAYEYVNNPDQTAYVGYTLSVTNDPDPKNNGLYYVSQIAEGEVTEGLLEKVGSGNGSQVLNEFTVNEDGSIAEATEDNIGQVIYIKEGTEEYPAGPYIVTGVGTVLSMTTAPAGEDISTAVSALQGEVANVKSDVQNLQSKDEELASADVALGERIDAVIESVNDKAAQSDLDAVSEKVTANESAISSLDEKVNALSSATHFIGVKGSLDEVTDPKAGDIVIVDSKEYVYDEEKSWVELGDTTAVEQRIDSLEQVVGDAEGGLVKEVADNKAAADAVAERVTAVETKASDNESAISGISERVDALETADSDINARIDNVAADLVTLGNDLSAHKVKDVDPTAASGVSLSLSEVGVVKVGVDVETLANEIIAKHVVDSEDIKLGANIGTDATPDRYTTEDTVQGVLASMNTRIESIDADIQSALEGGVTGIEQGNGIVVDSTTATKPKVSVKVSDINSALSLTASGLAVSVAEGSAIVATDNGLDLQWSQF